MLSHLDHQTWTIRASSAVLARQGAGDTFLGVAVGEEEGKLPWLPQVAEAMWGGGNLKKCILFPYLVLLLQNCTFFIFYNNCNILLNCSNTQTIEKLNIYAKLKFQPALEKWIKQILKCLFLKLPKWTNYFNFSYLNNVNN